MSNISDYEDGMYPGILMIVEDPKNKHQPFTKYERHPGSTTWTRKQAGPPAGHLEDPLEEHDSIATPFKSKWSKGKSAGQLTDPFADLGLGPPPPPPSNDDGVDFKNLTTLEKRILGMCSRTTHPFPTWYPKRDHSLKKTFIVSLSHSFIPDSDKPAPNTSKVKAKNAAGEDKTKESRSNTRAKQAQTNNSDEEEGSFKWVAYVTWGKDPQPPINRLCKSHPRNTTTAAMESLLTELGLKLDIMIQAGKFDVKSDDAQGKAGSGNVKPEGAARKPASGHGDNGSREGGRASFFDDRTFERQM